MQTTTQTDVTYGYATRPMPGMFSREELITRLEAGIESSVRLSQEDIERMSAVWVG